MPWYYEYSSVIAILTTAVSVATITLLSWAFAVVIMWGIQLTWNVLLPKIKKTAP